MILYLETSALLRWLLMGPRGDEVFDLLKRAERVAASRLVLGAARRILTRRESAGLQSAQSAGIAHADLAAEAARWDIVELGEPIWLRAEARFPLEPVRMLDALHLASALHYLSAVGELKMLSFDERVLGNWKAMGLAAAADE
ncbi:MAG TPA: PIN domain-containing protein [Myxococcaceae bacterium]|nr:PIN domain-containing protein [Myxococcaceae bacterium]